MSERYQIERLAGYTDGKPSWRKTRFGIFGKREDAITRMAEEISDGSLGQFRVRKMRPTKGRR